MISLKFKVVDCDVCGGPQYIRRDRFGARVNPCNNCDDGLAWLRTWMIDTVKRAVRDAANNLETYDDLVERNIIHVRRGELFARELETLGVATRDRDYGGRKTVDDLRADEGLDSWLAQLRERD